MPPRHVHDHTRECLQVAVLDPGGPSLHLEPRDRGHRRQARAPSSQGGTQLWAEAPTLCPR